MTNDKVKYTVNETFYAKEMRQLCRSKAGATICRYCSFCLFPLAIYNQNDIPAI